MAAAVDSEHQRRRQLQNSERHTLERDDSSTPQSIPLDTSHHRPMRRLFGVMMLPSLGIMVIVSAIAIALLSSQHECCYHNVIVVDAMKLTSLGSSLYDGIRRNNYNQHQGTMKSENGDPDGDGEVAEEERSSLACSSSIATCSSTTTTTSSSSYGVDRSFPIHHHYSTLYAEDEASVGGSGGEEWLLPNKQQFYKEYMEGCRHAYYPEGYRCDVSEDERIEMNLRQPASMFNYTTLGFHRVRAPPEMMTILNKFWSHHFTDNDIINNVPNEIWSRGDTYTNHWSSPTKLLSITDSSSRKIIWDTSKEVLEQWTGVQLSPSSMYGVRIYTNGSVLAPHVDRNPLVISAVVNVAQDVDDDWPLEVYGRDGKAYNLTLEVGEMILYEGHSVIHGRPFPLNGRYYANLFIHFEPLGHSLQMEERIAEDEESLEYLYKEAWKKSQSKCSDTKECMAAVDLNVAPMVPHYILPGSEEERRWRQTHPKAKLDSTIFYNTWYQELNAHTAASSGDLEALIIIASRNIEDVKRKDQNGWTPLHEAARGGHVDVVAWLLERGLDKNERTHNGTGGSPLWWAKKSNGINHEVVRYFESIGAEEIPPDGLKKIQTEEDVDPLEIAIKK